MTDSYTCNPILWRALTQQGQIIFIEGPCGSGKTFSIQKTFVISQKKKDKNLPNRVLTTLGSFELYDQHCIRMFHSLLSRKNNDGSIPVIVIDNCDGLDSKILKLLEKWVLSQKNVARANNKCSTEKFQNSVIFVSASKTYNRTMDSIKKTIGTSNCILFEELSLETKKNYILKKRSFLESAEVEHLASCCEHYHQLNTRLRLIPKCAVSKDAEEEDVKNQKEEASKLDASNLKTLPASLRFKLMAKKNQLQTTHLKRKRKLQEMRIKSVYLNQEEELKPSLLLHQSEKKADLFSDNIFDVVNHIRTSRNFRHVNQTWSHGYVPNKRDFVFKGRNNFNKNFHSSTLNQETKQKSQQIIARQRNQQANMNAKTLRSNLLHIMQTGGDGANFLDRFLSHTSEDIMSRLHASMPHNVESNFLLLSTEKQVKLMDKIANAEDAFIDADLMCEEKKQFHLSSIFATDFYKCFCDIAIVSMPRLKQTPVFNPQQFQWRCQYEFDVSQESTLIRELKYCHWWQTSSCMMSTVELIQRLEIQTQQQSLLHFEAFPRAWRDWEDDHRAEHNKLVHQFLISWYNTFSLNKMKQTIKDKKH